MTTTGIEHRSNKWQMPKLRFNIATGIKNHRQMQQILAFFRCCRGRQIGFRYKDWSDFKASHHPLKILHEHSAQLVKTYKIDNDILETRIITKPVNGTIRIYIDNNQLMPEEYSVDYTTGIITFARAINEVTKLTADFEFDTAVRFDTDYLPIIVESYDFYSLPEIPVVEIRE